MGDYNKLSNFSPKANFNMVRFGANAPITECELNETQQILDYKHKQLAKSLGDKFTNPGEMSATSSKRRKSQQFKIENSDLIVDGDPIHISKLETPIKEGQTVYLKVFEKDVDKDSELKNYGNEQEEVLENNLLDPRLYGVESARRVQTCYDIETQTTLTKEEFATENGVKEFSCKNGYVDNVVIEGETLVNLVLQNTTNMTNDRNRVECENVMGATEFTVINNSNLVIRVDIFKNGVYLRYTEHQPKTVEFVELNEGEVLGLFSFIYAEESNEDTLKEFKTGFVILEGDHTDKPISYFEGLKSVGQGDKIDVVSYKKDSNLFDNIFIEGYYNADSGNFVSEVGAKASLNIIPIKPNTKYTSYSDTETENNYVRMTWYDANKKLISQDRKKTNTSPLNARYMHIHLNNSTKIVINEGETIASNDYKQDHKQISTTLRSLPNGVKDTIEKRGNKYVKVQRCGEYTYVGEDFSYYASNDNMHHIQLSVSAIKNVREENILISNLILHESNSGNIYFGIFVKDYAINILLPLDLHNSQDSIKNYLKDNNFTVVYELETPIITELPNFNPKIFEGDTTLLLNTGAIQGECSFDVYTYQEPVFEEDITYIPLMQLHQGVEKDLRITDPNRVNYKSLNKDDNGQFTRVEVYRQNNTLKEVSELSELVEDNYTVQTMTYYDELGVSVLYSEIYSLEYDEDGDLIGQELIKRC